MPDWSPDLRPHLNSLRLTPEREADILEELSQHLDERWRALLASGESEADAERTVRSEARSATRLHGALAPLRQSRAAHAQLEWPGSQGPSEERLIVRIARRCAAELTWAWRGVRSRGWRAALVVALIGLALAGNVLVFAVADSVVFRPVTYPNAHELVEIQRVRQPGARADGFMSANLLDTWRQQTDLFASVHAYLTKTVFLVADGRSELVTTADVTPGLIEMLGARPGWGRSLTAADTSETGTIPALISARLARERYGRPEGALNHILETTAQALLVVGVMPDQFKFPSGTHAIWRVMDPRGPLTRNFAGVRSIARTVPGLTTDVLTERMAQRSGAVGQAAGAGEKYSAIPGLIPMADAGPPAAKVRTMFLTLVGGALFLLLTACANVANLEVAGAMHRARKFAVRLALGASPATLGRVVLLEGALLTTAGVAAGAGLAWLAVGVVTSYVPVGFTRFSVNPIDLDTRALLYMATIAMATWCVVSLPTVLYASSAHLLALLKSDDRSAAQSRRGAFVRRTLTVLEVAIAVILVVGGLLYTRSYLALLHVDKGFDSTNLAEIAFAIPVEYHDQPAEFSQFADEVVSRVRAVPGVLAAVQGSAPPSTGNSPFSGVGMEIDGRRLDRTFTVGDTPVDPAYFHVIGLTLRQGRWLEPGDVPTDVIVTESFARQFWPDGQAVGRTFRRLVGGNDLPSAPTGVGTAEGGKLGIVITKPVVPPSVVVGVVSEFRSTRPALSTDSPDALYYYTPSQPTPPAPPSQAPAVARAASTGGSWRFLNVTVRLDSPERAARVLEAARSVDRRLRVTMESVDAMYAEMFGDVLLATRITTGFSVVAMLVALVGIYGVMAYLVMSRRREIGVRMALGARPGDILRLVIASSARLVLVGIAIGTAVALGLARWTASQFFGVSAMAPGSYVMVALVVAAAALVATWHPARQAARVDPVRTLRSE